MIALTATPGKQCKVVLPPCSALELKNAALAPPGECSSRAVLECQLATRSFVLCSLTPDGPRQAALGTVVMNDPEQAAWVFLKARGATFHVLGRLVTEDKAASRDVAGRHPKPQAKPKTAVSAAPSAAANASEAAASRQSQAARPTPRSTSTAAVPAQSTGVDQMMDTGWGLGAAVRGSKATSAEAPAAVVDEAAEIEVTLPEGDDGVECPSDADSDGFVSWMQSRASKTRRTSSGGDRMSTSAAHQGGAPSAEAPGKLTPNRSARRRAAKRRFGKSQEAEI